MFIKYSVAIFALLIHVSAWATPTIQTWETDNHAKVYYVDAPELPMIDLNVVFNAGAARDGEKNGISRLTIAMLNEGAAGLDADAIATSFADVGAHFGISAERDMAVVSLRSLTEEKALTQALSTFTAVLSQPSFPEDAFQRIQRNVLTGLQAEKQSPSAIATRLFYENLFTDHPYGVMPQGEEESVQQLTPADLKAFYEQYYVSANAVVVIVGAVDKVKATKIANQITANLAQGQAVPMLPTVPDMKAAELLTQDYPSSQTTILMGQPGMSRHDPDYFSLYVGNHILGGSGLVSMLSNEIREKRGLTYSVYSYFRPMQQSGPYQFVLQTRNEKAQEALSVLKQTVTDFIANGPTTEQLEAAKQNITGGFALRVDSNSKIADYLSVIGFYGLPLNYLDMFNDKINAVTVEAIKDAYQRRVHPDRMLTVMVGGQTAQTN
jgi:zinc protease